jgi:diaminohydroxyphosphoribosylaminopyrimidine deaminase/5-amino-6-(5-phosphoribosylamino)uracil reductase
MSLTELDRARLRQALQLAQEAIGLSDPNPRVGCVVGRDDGSVLGRGFTQEAGGPHAEIMALRDAAGQGADLRGATAWVTLEPCAHYGRTPPCCDALLAAGIGRVVAAIEDPYHAVDGRGLARLRAAGVEVVLASGAITDAARELNIGFFSRALRGRPWVRLKAACSLDGRTALPSGESQWITGPEARADGHAWRRRAGVVLTGIGTVLADDPRLDVRLVPTTRQPRRAVLDSAPRLAPTAQICATTGTLIYTLRTNESAAAALAAVGAEIVTLPRAPGGGIYLNALLADLAGREVNELHVEAGARLTAAWLDSGLADELLLYMAPMLLMAGPGVAALPAPAALKQALRFELNGLHQVGGDVRLLCRAAGSGPDRWPHRS